MTNGTTEQDRRMLQRAMGQRIRDLRQQRGWTQRELAAASGISFAQIGKIERGESNVRLTSLVAVVQKLDATVYELFRGIEPGSDGA